MLLLRFAAASSATAACPLLPFHAQGKHGVAVVVLCAKTARWRKRKLIEGLFAQVLKGAGAFERASMKVTPSITMALTMCHSLEHPDFKVN